MNRELKFGFSLAAGLLAGILSHAFLLQPVPKQSTAFPAERAAGKKTARPRGSNPECCVYDSNPAHIWNRLFSTLFIRQDPDGKTYGADELDPLLWSGTKFLLTEPSHRDAMHILDEFLEVQAQNQVHDPVKKALLERDLWAVFDWSARRHDDHAAERQELQIRLAAVLRSLALTKKEIAALQDNYQAAVASGEFARQYDPDNRERAFLPPDLFEPDGSWVGMAGSAGPLSKIHVREFSGRSTFMEFIRLPQGRKATLDYLQALQNYPNSQGGNPVFSSMTRNPGIPQFPAGTELALVRQMNLFDRDGSLAAAPLTESIQIRVFRDPQSSGASSSLSDQNALPASPDVFEIKLDRAKLLAGKAGGLEVVTRDEQHFRMLLSHGFDFEARVRTLGDCAICHAGAGIYSMQSAASLLKPSQAQWGAGDASGAEKTSTLFWKQEQYDWGLLNGYWRSLPAANPRKEPLP